MVTMLSHIFNPLPQQIFSGEGALRSAAAALPCRTAVLLDEGLDQKGGYAEAKSALSSVCGHVFYISLSSREPRLSDLTRTLSLLEKAKPACIMGIGGGSVLDTAKAAAVLFGSRAAVDDALAAPPQTRAIQLVAVPTTAGTGSEATPNALFIDDRSGRKSALITPACVPDAAVLDPALTVNLPPEITACTGVDAICHLAESLISIRAGTLSRFYSEGGLRLALTHLPACITRPHDTAARVGMLEASLWGGAALSLAGTTAVHALAYALGRRGVPHGAANSLLFQAVMDITLPDIRDRLPDYDAICALITALPLPDIRRYGLTVRDIPDLVSESLIQTRLLSNHPAAVDADTAQAIFERVLDGRV